LRFLREELDWPLGTVEADFEDLTFDYTPDELGIDPAIAAKIEEIKRLRPLVANQPWGVFFVKFEPKQLPVVALRRILNSVAIKKRASGAAAEQVKWRTDDLLFISSYGEGDERKISFAHFSQPAHSDELPTLKVLAWDDLDTPLHLDHAANVLVERLAWPAPEDEQDDELWRERWASAFELRHREVINTSKALAVRLAQLARIIRERIRRVLEIETEKGPVTGLMNAFREALVHDLDDEGFADMYAQTIAYGLLSARIANPKEAPADDVRSVLPATNPLLRDLLETFLRVGGQGGRATRGAGIDFDELGVTEVIELLDDANMEAVVRDFGDRNLEEDPVIHFYELFLKEYDAKKRMQRGVFYTPRPVVSYIVRSVDEFLRTKFGLEDGLADTTTWGEMAERHADLRIPHGVDPGQAFVQILDPATGTGTFLVEVIDLIHRTMTDKWKAQGHGGSQIEELWNAYVPRHLLQRLHGYELLMAPYAIAHLKIGLKLSETGYAFGSDERARIYLTNALEPAHDFSGQLEFTVPALAHEALAVNDVKRDLRFTVVIGNPPYAIHSGNLSPSARAIVDRYRHSGGDAIRERGALQFEKNLQNDYVKFVRLAELIVSESRGVVGYVTSHAFLTNRTLRGMRESLQETFSLLRFLNLHGNAASGEAAAFAKIDQNVFEITEGVAISLMVKAPIARADSDISYSDLVGLRSDKYEWLTRNSVVTTEWVPVMVSAPNRVFKPTGGAQAEFESGVPLEEIFEQRSAGVITARDGFATDESRETLIRRVEKFASSDLSGAQLREAFRIKDKKGWDVDRAQRQVREQGPLRECVHPYLYRPFDSRYIAYSRGIVWGMAYPTLRHTLDGDNLVLIAMQQYQYDVPEYCYTFVSRGLTDSRIFVSKTGVATLLPLYLNPAEGANLGMPRTSNIARPFLTSLNVGLESAERPDASGPARVADATPEAAFNYIYALLHSSSYRSRFAEQLKSSFPRVFLPAGRALFRSLARLGGELVAVHLSESPTLGRFITNYVGPDDPEVGRVGWSDDAVWLDAGASKKGQAAKPGTIGIRGVPEDVWQFHIGGYQVCHKWLKDRKGRTLSHDDIAHYQRIIEAVSETIRLMEEIDEVIESYGGWPGAFSTSAEAVV
jgi:hypothetical protein